MHLTCDEIAERLGLTVSIKSVSPQSAHIGEDGYAMVVCSLRVDAEESDGGCIAVVLDGKDTALTHIPKDLAPRFGWHFGAAAYGNGLIFLSRCTRPTKDETRGAFLPRNGMKWGTAHALKVAPDLPTRVTSQGFAKQVMPAEKGIGRGDVIAWPVEALTGSPETSVKSVAFFRLDIPNGRLNWSYWPERPQAKSLVKTLFLRGSTANAPQDFVRPDPHAFPIFEGEGERMPNILSAIFDGTRLLITSDGATEVKKYGDRCAAVAEVQCNGDVNSIYLEDFIKADRPDASKQHDYQARFVSGGQYVLLKSRYKSTDPWKGGFALFDVADRSLRVCEGPKSGDYQGPIEIVGEDALFVDFDDKRRMLSLRLENIIFA